MDKDIDKRQLQIPKIRYIHLLFDHILRVNVEIILNIGKCGNMSIQLELDCTIFSYAVRLGVTLCTGVRFHSC